MIATRIAAPANNTPLKIVSLIRDEVELVAFCYSLDHYKDKSVPRYLDGFSAPLVDAPQRAINCFVSWDRSASADWSRQGQRDYHGKQDALRSRHTVTGPLRPMRSSWPACAAKKAETQSRRLAGKFSKLRSVTTMKRAAPMCFD